MVLDLPVELCAAQAMGRRDHEGGLQGPEARRVVLNMTGKLRKEGYPTKSEGLRSVIVSYLPGINTCLMVCNVARQSTRDEWAQRLV